MSRDEQDDAEPERDGEGEREQQAAEEIAVTKVEGGRPGLLASGHALVEGARPERGWRLNSAALPLTVKEVTSSRWHHEGTRPLVTAPLLMTSVCRLRMAE